MFQYSLQVLAFCLQHSVTVRPEGVVDDDNDSEYFLIIISQITICYANFLEKDGPVTRRERKTYLSWAYRLLHMVTFVVIMMIVQV